MTGVRKRDGVWEGLLIRIDGGNLRGQLEPVADSLQAADEVHLVGLSEGSTSQIDWDFPTGGDGAEQELAHLFPGVGGNIADIAETAESGNVRQGTGSTLTLQGAFQHPLETGSPVPPPSSSRLLLRLPPFRPHSAHPEAE